VGAKLDARELLALQRGRDVDLAGLIGAVKHESVWIVAVIFLVCVLYFVGMRMSEHRSHADAATKN
jgi:hypothetical protein